jgi:hypothetical protein
MSKNKAAITITAWPIDIVGEWSRLSLCMAGFFSRSFFGYRRRLAHRTQSRARDAVQQQRDHNILRL